MIYALAFVIMSAALVGGSWVYPSLRIPLVWAAISYAWVALGYAGVGARVFGKKEDGRIPWGMKLFLFPYISYTWAVWHCYRIFSREDPFNRVDDLLVVGRRLVAKEVPEGFDNYVDLTAELQDAARIRSAPSYRVFPILDAGVPSVVAFRKMVEAIGQGRTYVHCAQGHGRTALLAIALLLHRRRVGSIDEGLSVLKRVRPAMGLNRAQKRFLQRYLLEVSRTPGG